MSSSSIPGQACAERAGAFLVCMEKGSCTDIKSTVADKTLWRTFVSVVYTVLHEELIHEELLHEELLYLSVFT